MADQQNYERINVLFFVNAKGYIIIAPDQRHPCPEGFEKRYATSLSDIDKLTRILNRQDSDMFGRLFAKDRAAMAAKHAEIKSKLGQRLLSIDCHPNERLFITSMFRYLDRKEEELLKCEVRGFFHAREYDGPGHDPIEQHGRQLEATQPKMSDRLASLLSR